MPFTPIAVADLPTAVVGAKAKEISAEDQATALVVAGIVKSGNAARSGETFVTKPLAESAGRKFAGMLNKALPPLDGGMVYRYRAFAVGTAFTFAIVTGAAPTPRAKKETPAE